MEASALVRSVFGFSRVNTQPLVDAVEVAYELMFVQGRSRNSIQLSRDIYAVVAQRQGKKKYSSVVRQLERLCNGCWDRIQESKHQMERLVGDDARDIDGPSDVIFLLACYLRYEKPFQVVLEQEPALTF